MAETITFGEFWESVEGGSPESRERIQRLADLYAKLPPSDAFRQRLDRIVQEEEPRLAVAKLAKGAYEAEAALGEWTADRGLTGLGDAFTEWYDAEYAREAPRVGVTDQFGSFTIDERVSARPTQTFPDGYPEMSAARRDYAELLRARAREREGAPRDYGPPGTVEEMLWSPPPGTRGPGGIERADMTPRQWRTQAPPLMGSMSPGRGLVDGSPQGTRNDRIAENVALMEERNPSWMPAFEGPDAAGDLAYGNVRGPSLGYASESLISDPRRPRDLRVDTVQETLLPDGETIDSVLTLQEQVPASGGGGFLDALGGLLGGTGAPAGTEEATASVTEPALPDPAAAVDQIEALTPSDYRAAPAQPEGGGMSPMSLGGALIGGAGIAAAIGNTIADFRTTAALEDQLAASAAGDTIARREGALAGSQAQRNIMATSLGRRDISPALALRNAQMAGSRTLSDVYGQAAIASARERRESEAQLAQLRKQRWNTLFGGLTRTAGDVGALLATQGAAEETANMNKRLTDLEASNLNQVGLAPGQRRR